jgi:hypothetical protein
LVSGVMLGKIVQAVENAAVCETSLRIETVLMSKHKEDTTMPVASCVTLRQEYVS